METFPFFRVRVRVRLVEMLAIGALIIFYIFKVLLFFSFKCRLFFSIHTQFGYQRVIETTTKYSKHTWDAFYWEIWIKIFKKHDFRKTTRQEVPLSPPYTYLGLCTTVFIIFPH